MSQCWNEAEQFNKTSVYENVSWKEVVKCLDFIFFKAGPKSKWLWPKKKKQVSNVLR